MSTFPKNDPYHLTLQEYSNERALLRHGLIKEDLETMAAIPVESLQRVGSGYFGTTYLVPYKNRLFLRKVKGADEKTDIIYDMELQMHRELSHIQSLAPYIPVYLGASISNTPHNRHGNLYTLSIFMEFIQGKNTIDMCKGKEQEVLASVEKALKAFRREGYQYYDIKSENPYDNFVMTRSHTGELIPVFVDIGGLRPVRPYETATIVKTLLEEQLSSIRRGFRACKESNLPVTPRMLNTLQPLSSQNETRLQKIKSDFEEDYSELQLLRKPTIQSIVFRTLQDVLWNENINLNSAAWIDQETQHFPLNTFDPLIARYYDPYKEKGIPLEDVEEEVISKIRAVLKEILLWFKTTVQPRNKNYKSSSKTLLQEMPRLLEELPPIAERKQAEKERRQREDQRRLQEEQERERLQREQMEEEERQRIEKARKAKEKEAASWRGFVKRKLPISAGLVNCIPHRQNLPGIGRCFRKGGTRKSSKLLNLKTRKRTV